MIMVMMIAVVIVAMAMTVMIVSRHLFRREVGEVKTMFLLCSLEVYNGLWLSQVNKVTPSFNSAYAISSRKACCLNYKT